ncbi:DUF4286 family protein [Roseisolibacter sp. H3M3-2]|uniref:DUF4286 family protein n=1 Tax=Roseisolibacter sp. H3M3-2 TaxID=3031323 RepID=UPI0023DC857F|nr:DUF4286 family protein [Roseisolibacter sp. H3M3-2]MDF1502323.1 DUF4286 family protein [Roseisolibacter sp. H3M3-2]
MIRYEVVAEVPPEARDSFARFQTERHIPDVLASGCFLSAAFEEEADGRFRASYVAADAEALERYLREHAPALRADFAAHAPAGVRLSRGTWTTVRRWDAGPLSR